jgi:hypothetical protein
MRVSSPDFARKGGLEQGRISRGGHGLLKVSLGPALSDPSTLCGRPSLKLLFQEWSPTGLPACGHLTTPSDTPRRTPVIPNLGLTNRKSVVPLLHRKFLLSRKTINCFETLTSGHAGTAGHGTPARHYHYGIRLTGIIEKTITELFIIVLLNLSLVKIGTSFSQFRHSPVAILDLKIKIFMLKISYYFVILTIPVILIP